MQKATNMAELRALLSASKPGDVIDIVGYIDSKGRLSDITVVRLEPHGYRQMQLSSLESLTSMVEESDLQQPTAESMISALKENLFGPPKGEFKDIYRDAGGFHVHKDAGTLEEVYLLRTAELASSTDPSPPKSADAKAKFDLAVARDLPTVRYRHALKFNDNKFDAVVLTPASELREETREAVVKATGAKLGETNENHQCVSETSEPIA